MKNRGLFNSISSHQVLSSRQIGLLALVLAIAGLALLYFWPTGPQYQPTQASAIAIARDGQWVQYCGIVQSAVKKTGGYSLRVCDDIGGCAAAFVSENIEGGAAVSAESRGGFARVSGEVATVSGGAKFVRTHKIEIEQG